MFFFFFSSRRRHTRWTGDWSSDVCSSDLDGTSAVTHERDAVPAPIDRATVAGGRQKPVEAEIHEELPTVSLNLRSLKSAKFTLTGISPAPKKAFTTCCSEARTPLVIGRASCRERV